MTTCSTTTCGTGGWSGPLPGDPSNNSILSATPAFGGVDVSWTYPTTYPEAVAHILLYRGISNNFDMAIQIAVVSGSQYYDKIEPSPLHPYYYWIQIVSVNGTIGDLIGPAAATPKGTIAEVLTGLTGQIDTGVLSQSLRTEIGKITLNYQELLAEVSARQAADAAYGTLAGQLQTDVDQAIAYVNTEITQRQEGDSALASQINLVAVANQNNAAAVLNEITARVSGDAALASQITTAQSVLGSNIASVQSGLQTNIDTVNGKVTSIGALYTAKVNVNGLIGGFGIYNDGSTVQAGFDVSTFWIGSTSANKIKPFIVNNGVTYIDDAAINKLTFSKLRDDAGTVVVENGKLKAAYLDVGSLTASNLTAGNAAISGTTMTGSGAVISSTGAFALGSGTATSTAPAGTNITYNNGVLTLNGDVVQTNNVKPNAISKGYSSNGANKTFAWSGTAAATIVTLSNVVITDSGTGVVLTFVAAMSSSSMGNYDAQATFTIKRNGTVVNANTATFNGATAGFEVPICRVLFDTPPVGTHTYTVVASNMAVPSSNGVATGLIQDIALYAVTFQR